MSRHDLTFPTNSYCAVEISIDETRVHANSFPSLIIYAEVMLRYSFKAPGYSMDVRHLRCRMGAFSRGWVTAHLDFPMQGQVTVEFANRKEHVYLEIPLAQSDIHRLEMLRNGGDMSVQLEMAAYADELVQLSKDQHAGAVWGLKTRHRLYKQIDLVIPREVWTNLLPQMGYGQIYLIELPVVPIDSCASLKHAHAALSQAHDLHRRGCYDDAVGKCRVALEPFFEHVSVDPTHPESRKIPQLKNSWEKRLGSETYKWLSGAFTAVKIPTNKPHHSPDRIFDQLDSQMLLAVTTSLISYAVRRGKVDDAV